MTPTIRLAGPADLAAIEAIVGAAYAHYIPRIGRKPGPMLDNYATLIAQNLVYVLDDAGSVQGILVLIATDSSMLLDNVAVSPAAQGLGFGRALLGFAEQTSRAAGFPSIHLYTNEAMTENIALYTRLGYVETHRAEERGLHRVYMTKMFAG